MICQPLPISNVGSILEGAKDEDRTFPQVRKLVEGQAIPDSSEALRIADQLIHTFLYNGRPMI